jgi:hypothetical protein
MPTPTPSLGYGQRGEASIDAVNRYMRSAPWYQALLQSFGQNPANVHLTDAQKQQVIRAAQAHGIIVDEGHNGQEVDDSGNFHAKSHALRNTLVVAGIAGAALLTAGAAGVFGGAAAGSGAAAGALPAGVTLEGTAAGLGGASTAVGGGALASTAVPATGALATGATGLAAGAGGAGAASAAGAAGAMGAFDAAGNFVGPTTISASAAPAASAGLSYADILKGVVPTAGNLIGGLIQAKSAGDASAAQQKYLEEALAYAKESDAYNRQRQARLDAQEVSRYGDYQGRIAPFIANGVTSNDRMTALLGLPARAPGAGGGSGSSGPPASQRVASDPATQAAIRKELQAVNSSDDPAGWDEYLASHGDSAAKNWDYWKHRIDIGDGVGKGYAGATSASAPSQGAASVQMRAPDGSVKAVPADQVDFYTARGATRLQGAA